VLAAGTRYLRVGQGILSSLCGDRIAVSSTLTTITVEVDIVDASRSFTVEILNDPTSGTPTVLGSLTLPVSTRGITTTALSVAIVADTEIGARVVRATGSGGSTFNSIVVNVDLIQ
jgi:hypothetical protein